MDRDHSPDFRRDDRDVAAKEDIIEAGGMTSHKIFEALRVVETVPRAGGSSQNVTTTSNPRSRLMICGSSLEISAHAEGDSACVIVRAALAAGESLRLSKFVAYHWAPQPRGGELLGHVEHTLGQAMSAGYGAIESAHSAEVEGFWRRSDIELEGDLELQRAVRFNLFSLMQATARAEGLGVPAKGVTGRGYEGHYFWDMEIYVVPFLCHTTPRWAKQVLEFRCRMLDAARTRAREIGHAGASYPWRTINGSEASAWYAAGTAQYHINADIAYAMHQYNRVTGDPVHARPGG